MLKIDQQIAETDVEAIRAMFPKSPYPCYPYQAAAYRLVGEEIRRANPEPFIIEASVSAGKTDMISMVCSRIQQMNNQQLQNNREPYQALVISRDAAIVDQDSAQLWKYGVQNSIFCAGLSRKATAYPIIVASEGTAVNALYDSVRDGRYIRVSPMGYTGVHRYAPGIALVTQLKKSVRRGELKDFTPLFLLVDECVTGDTLIETDNGNLRIDDPLLRVSKIKCMSEDSGRIFYHKPVRVFSNGTKRVSSIKCHSGEEIKCTGNHKLLSKDLWLRADSLKIGDTLTLCGRRDSFWKKLRRAVAAVAKELCQ